MSVEKVDQPNTSQGPQDANQPVVLQLDVLIEQAGPQHYILAIERRDFLPPDNASNRSNDTADNLVVLEE